MLSSTYETIPYQKDGFPLILHLDHSANDPCFLPHWHESIELLLFLEGQGTATLDEETYAVGTGDLLAIQPGVLHTLSASKPLRYYCLLADPFFCREMEIPLESLNLHPVTRDDKALTHYRAFIQAMEACPPYYRTTAKAEFALLLSTLAVRHPASDKGPLKPDSRNLLLSKKVIQLVHQEFASALTLDSISKELAFHPHYICHVFRETTGLSFLSYLNRFRCMQAQKLLRSGAAVKEAAMACGFETPSYFTRTYKRYIGRLPSEDQP